MLARFSEGILASMIMIDFKYIKAFKGPKSIEVVVLLAFKFKFIQNFKASTIVKSHTVTTVLLSLIY